MTMKDLMQRLTPQQAFALLYRRTALALVMSGLSLAMSVVLMWEHWPL